MSREDPIATGQTMKHDVQGQDTLHLHRDPLLPLHALVGALIGVVLGALIGWALGGGALTTQSVVHFATSGAGPTILLGSSLGLVLGALIGATTTLNDAPTDLPL